MCWIIPIIVGLICALLGYLLGKMFAGSKLQECNQSKNNLRNELDKLRKSYQEQIEAKNKEIAELKNQIAACESKVAGYQSKTSELENKIANFAQVTTPKVEETVIHPVSIFDAAMAKAVFGKTIKEDDLTIVEGIGPKIQELFKSNGITTWKILSETSFERLREILDLGGERFAIHNPGTWARQAALAHQGKWQELKEWQEKLFGGVE